MLYLIKEQIGRMSPCVEDVADCIKEDVTGTIMMKISTMVSEEAEHTISSKIDSRKIEKLVQEKILEEKEEIKEAIVSEVAHFCLKPEEKEKLIKEVRKEMIKQSTYRTDLIDLSD